MDVTNVNGVYAFLYNDKQVTYGVFILTNAY